MMQVTAVLSQITHRINPCFVHICGSTINKQHIPALSIVGLWSFGYKPLLPCSLYGITHTRKKALPGKLFLLKLMPADKAIKSVKQEMSRTIPALGTPLARIYSRIKQAVEEYRKLSNPVSSSVCFSWTVIWPIKCIFQQSKYTWYIMTSLSQA